MNEVVKLQLIGLTVVGLGIVILLLFRPSSPGSSDLSPSCSGLFSLVALCGAADGLATARGRKIRHRHRQDPDRYGRHRAENLFQQGPVRAVPFHRPERIGAVPGSERHRRQAQP